MQGFLAPLIVSTITGSPLVNRLPIVGEPSWTRQAGRGGTIIASVQLPAAEWSHADVTRLLQKRRASIAFEHVVPTPMFGMAGQPAVAGVIIDHSYDARTGVLEVRAEEVRRMTAGRTLWTVSEMRAGTARQVTFKGSWESIARQCIETAYVNVAATGARARLPIRQTWVAAGNETLSVAPYELKFVDDILEELETMDGGIRTDFLPAITTAGALEWQFRAGRTLSSPHPTFDVRVARGIGAAGEAEWAKVAGSAARFGTGAFFRAEGGEDRQIIGLANETDVGLVTDAPYFDVLGSDITVKSKQVADAKARWHLRQAAKDESSRDLIVQCGDELPLYWFQPGQLVRVLDPAGDNYAQPTEDTFRVVGHRYLGGMRLEVQLEAT